MAECQRVAFLDRDGVVTVEDVVVPDSDIGLFRLHSVVLPDEQELKYFLSNHATPSTDERFWWLHSPDQIADDQLINWEDRLLGQIRVLVKPIKPDYCT